MSKVLPHNWAVPDRFRARLGTQAGRQRAMVHDGHLLIILHSVPEPGEAARKAVLFWRAPDGAWKSAGGAKGGLAGLRAHVEELAKAVQALEDRVETAARASEYFSVLQGAGPLLRTVRNLHKTLQEAREQVPGDVDLIVLRDHGGDVERAAELLYSDAKNGLEFTIAKRAEEQAELSERISRSSHRLNLLAALFFPVTAFGTMFGMNMAHGLEHTFAPWLFWAVLSCAFFVGFVLRSALGHPTRSA